jgi:hypothetical protein
MDKLEIFASALLEVAQDFRKVSEENTLLRNDIEFVKGELTSRSVQEMLSELKEDICTLRHEVEVLKRMAMKQPSSKEPVQTIELSGEPGLKAVKVTLGSHCEDSARGSEKSPCVNASENHNVHENSDVKPMKARRIAKIVPPVMSEKDVKKVDEGEPFVGTNDCYTDDEETPMKRRFDCKYSASKIEAILSAPIYTLSQEEKEFRRDELRRRRQKLYRQRKATSV